MFGKKKTNYFYTSLTSLISGALDAINVLKEGLIAFDSNKLLELKNSVHDIEHKLDLEKHQVEEKLAKEFLTPIDRADIFLLLDSIDDLTDAIDEISYKLYIRNYQKLPEGINEFIEETVKAIEATCSVVNNLINLKDKKIMDPLIQVVQNYEEQLDKMYEEKVRDLYATLTDYKEIRLSERVYEYFESISDKCRDICKEISIIMYKNL